MPERYELTQAQWRRIEEDLLPGKAGDWGRTAADNRTFVDGVLWVLRSGRTGVICPHATATGRAPTSALLAGPERAFGRGSLRFSPQTLRTTTS